jgi:hypothetical protein
VVNNQSLLFAQVLTATTKSRYLNAVLSSPIGAQHVTLAHQLRNNTNGWAQRAIHVQRIKMCGMRWNSFAKALGMAVSETLPL